MPLASEKQRIYNESRPLRLRKAQVPKSGGRPRLKHYPIRQSTSTLETRTKHHSSQQCYNLHPRRLHRPNTSLQQKMDDKATIYPLRDRSVAHQGRWDPCEQAWQSLIGSPVPRAEPQHGPAQRAIPRTPCAAPLQQE